MLLIETIKKEVNKYILTPSKYICEIDSTKMNYEVIQNNNNYIANKYGKLIRNII